MDDYLSLMAVLAILGSGLVTGLLFAFSNFVMAALCDLPPVYGQKAMQQINLRIINPIFLILFMGSALLCAGIVLILVFGSGPGRDPLLMLGALAYLIGPFAITAARNVPLNDVLADASAEDAEWIWPNYVKRWLFWNHLRTILGVLAIALLSYGLRNLA